MGATNVAWSSGLMWGSAAFSSSVYFYNKINWYWKACLNCKNYNKLTLAVRDKSFKGFLHLPIVDRCFQFASRTFTTCPCNERHDRRFIQISRWLGTVYTVWQSVRVTTAGASQSTRRLCPAALHPCSGGFIWKSRDGHSRILVRVKDYYSESVTQTSDFFCALDRSHVETGSGHPKTVPQSLWEQFVVWKKNVHIFLSST